MRINYFATVSVFIKMMLLDDDDDDEDGWMSKNDYSLLLNAGKFQS